MKSERNVDEDMRGGGGAVGACISLRKKITMKKIMIKFEIVTFKNCFNCRRILIMMILYRYRNG